MRDAAKEERAAWALLVAHLEKNKAVTKLDSKSPVYEIDTPGKRIYYAIRAWGEAYYRLRKTS